MSHKSHHSKKSSSKKSHCSKRCDCDDCNNNDDCDQEQLPEQLRELRREACDHCEDRCSRSNRNLKVCDLCVKGTAFFKGDVGIQGELVVGGAINAIGGIVGPVSTCDLLTKQISVNPTCPLCPSDPENNTIFINAEVAASPVNTFGDVPYSVFKADQCSGEFANITLVVAPKGNGALIASEPDGLILGGNNRGIYATDLQRRRELETQVASGENSVIGGGQNNEASAFCTTVAGGCVNAATFEGSTVGGGELNLASGIFIDFPSVGFATVAGGVTNTASGPRSTVGGGINNNVSTIQGTIGGGATNRIITTGATPLLGGSETIAGGQRNTASINVATIGGGSLNTATGTDANGRGPTVGGGERNIASGRFATVGGGERNTASGDCSTIPGGCRNIATGLGSFAAGNNAQAIQDNTFVFGSGDGTIGGVTTTTTAANQAVFNLGLLPGNFAPLPLSNTFFVNGNFTATGLKLFTIDHPILENKSLRHMCIEAPRPDLMYRGTVRLVNGRAEVDVDSSSKMTDTTFANLTKNVQAYITVRSNPNKNLIEIENYDVLSTGKFAIISDNNESNATVDWLVIAERKWTEEILIEINNPKINQEIYNDIKIEDEITISSSERLLKQNRFAKVNNLPVYLA